MSIGALAAFLVCRGEVVTGIHLVGVSRPAPGPALNDRMLRFVLLLEQVGPLFPLGYPIGYPLILDSSPRAPARALVLE
jgi:hypothetical protein